MVGQGEKISFPPGEEPRPGNWRPVFPPPPKDSYLALARARFNAEPFKFITFFCAGYVVWLWEVKPIVWTILKLAWLVATGKDGAI